jgi:hypothetical protein
MTLNSDTPIVENALITDDVTLVVLNVLLKVLIMDDNISVHPPTFYYVILNSNCCSDINTFSNVRLFVKPRERAGSEPSRCLLPILSERWNKRAALDHSQQSPP